MTTENDKLQVKAKPSATRFTLNFAVIFVIVFLTQVPGCIVVCADDAGQIDFFKHEKLINFSTATFASPLRLLLSPVDSLGSLLLVYFGNIVLLSFVVFLLVLVWRRIKAKRNFQ